MPGDENQTQLQQRGLLGTLLERPLTWLCGYPPERCNYSTQTIQIPTSTDFSRVELAATLYQPHDAGAKRPLGTILMRSPYGRAFPISTQASAFAARGYQVLLVSSRGTFGSGGEFDPCRTEVEDGKGVLEWMRKQPWYTGTFATIGGSYLGFVQWALLCDPPEDLVAAVPMVSPHDFARATWGTGALDLDIVRWSNTVAHQEETYPFWRILKSKLGSDGLDAVLRSVPFSRNVESHIGEGHSWVHNLLTISDISDPHYTPMRLRHALERTNIPILIITGWYDIFIEQSIEQYLRLRERGCNVALTVGPWAHIATGFAQKSNAHCFDWVDVHLGGNTAAKRECAVEYFVTGANKWKSTSVYPPPTEPVVFYLEHGGRLTSEALPSDGKPSTFTFDPQHPTPTMGGNGLIGGGGVDDSALAKRDDLLVFETAPLERDMEFCGKSTTELSHSADSPYADVFVRISEVDEQGKSRNVTEAFKRLDPERNVGEGVKLGLRNCSHLFLKGKRIRVIVAGGNFPQYARNNGVANEDNNGIEMRPVKHTIGHSATRPSKVVFPILQDI